MRWADLDQLRHVNNVVYVDYLQEARVDMLRAHGRGPGALVEGLVVVRHEVTYVAPLTFGFRPVSIECWVTEIRAATFTMAYELFTDDAAGERTVHLRARTVLTPFVFAEERPRRITAEEREALLPHLEPDDRTATRTTALAEPVASRYDVQVRFSDVDVYGHVNNVKYFEYLQEARILFLHELTGGERDFHLVVAQVDVDYRAPILFREAPYECRTTVAAVGTRSMTLDSDIRDGDRLLARARAVLVFYDLDRQCSTEPPAAVRERLVALTTT
jgi:acyl-CoA thioester hydrolase